VQPVTLDKRALRCLLDLAERGAAADGAKFAPQNRGNLVDLGAVRYRTWKCDYHAGRARFLPGPAS